MSFWNTPVWKRTGSYSPVFVLGTNMDSAVLISADPWYYELLSQTRIHIWGAANFKATAASPADFTASLPSVFSRTFAAETDVSGSFATTLGDAGIIRATVAANTVTLEWNPEASNTQQSTVEIYGHLS